MSINEYFEWIKKKKNFTSYYITMMIIFGWTKKELKSMESHDYAESFTLKR